MSERLSRFSRKRFTASSIVSEILIRETCSAANLAASLSVHPDGGTRTAEAARRSARLANGLPDGKRTGSKVSCKTTGCRFSMSLIQGLAHSQALLNLSSRGLIVFFAFEQSSVEHPETFFLEG